MARACLRYQTRAVMWLMIRPDFLVVSIERIHSDVQQPCRFIGTKQSAYIRKELYSHRIGLVYQHGHGIVLEH